MKLLLNDVIQDSDAPDSLKSPALADYYDDAVSEDLVLAEKSTINCIGIGYTDATELLINSLSAWISEEYTNLVTDPTDPSSDNWTKYQIDTPIDSGQTINGIKLWTITSTSGGTIILSTNITPTASIGVYSFILRQGTLDTISIDLLTATAYNDEIAVTFSTQSVTASSGATLLSAEWIDDTTVIVYIMTDTLTAESHSLRFFKTGTTAGDTFLVSQPQFVDNTTTIFPFVDGTHSADVVDETYTMPDKFTLDMIIEPKFTYDGTSKKYLFSFYVDSTHRVYIYWEPGSDKLFFVWQDGGTAVSMSSQVFDDGTSYPDINQRLRIIASLDLISGGIDDSRFIVIPLEEGDMNEDTSWNVTPDIKSSTFPALSIGNYAGSLQADSEIEYLRTYDGLLVGDVTSSSGVDALLSDMDQLFKWRGFPLINGGIYPETIELADTDTNGLYELENEIYSDEITISHNGTYMGRFAAGEERTMYASPSREPGFWTTNAPRQTLSGQIIPGAGGVSGRLLQLKFTYKFTADIFSDIELAWAEQLSRGYPIFIYFDNESHNIPWTRLYANFGNASGDDFVLQNSIWKALYSKTVQLKEAF